MMRTKKPQISLRRPLSNSNVPIISVHNDQKDLLFSETSVKYAVDGLVSFLSIITDEIVIHFVTKERISKLHAHFFDDPTPTDCITFPLDASGSACEDSILGEVFVCPHVALEYANEHEENPLVETTLYIIHGVLHLLGYEDTSEAQKVKMRRAEKESLAYLKEKKLLLSC